MRQLGGPGSMPYVGASARHCPSWLCCHSRSPGDTLRLHAWRTLPLCFTTSNCRLRAARTLRHKGTFAAARPLPHPAIGISPRHAAARPPAPVYAHTRRCGAGPPAAGTAAPRRSPPMCVWRHPPLSCAAPALVNDCVATAAHHKAAAMHSGRLELKCTASARKVYCRVAVVSWGTALDCW